MKWTLIPISLTVLISGCVKVSDSYCDVAFPIYFDTPEVVEWLSKNDPSLLKEIVIHNEQQKRICS